MNQDFALQYLDGLFVDACVALFHYQDSPIRPVRVEDFNFSEMVVAGVDGGSDDFEVVLSLNLPFSALAMTYPVPSVAHISEDDLEDWASELANRLLGKFNDELAKTGHRLKVGLPQREVGAEFVQVLGPGGIVCVHDFHIDGELFRATMQIELLKDDIAFIVQEPVGDGSVSSGDLELF